MKSKARVYHEKLHGNPKKIKINANGIPGRGKVLTGLGFQTIGSILEALGVTEELQFLRREAKRLKKGDLSNLSSEEKAVLGVWLQAIGQSFELYGFQKQLSAARDVQREGRKIAILGNLLQSYGAALEAIGETELLLKDEAPQFLF